MSIIFFLFVFLLIPSTVTDAMNSGCLQTDTVLESENLGAFWQTRLHLSYTELLYPFLPLQLRAVLHQLLQREAAAAVHRAHTEV